VAAVDAGRVGQRDVILGRDAGLEAAAGQRDGEGVLRVRAAGLDALVADDALRVVPDVEVVVHLHRLVHVGGLSPMRLLWRKMMMAGSGGVALAGLGRRRRRAEALGGGARRPRGGTEAPAGRSARGGRRSAPCSP